MLAYGLWGLVAAYWKLLAQVSPVELIAHRAVWGLFAFIAITLAFGQGHALRLALRERRLVGVAFLWIWAGLVVFSIDLSAERSRVR